MFRHSHTIRSPKTVFAVLKRIKDGLKGNPFSPSFTNRSSGLRSGYFDSGANITASIQNDLKFTISRFIRHK